MYKLTRIGDGAGQLGNHSNAIKWKEDGSGTFDEVISERPTVGCSMLVLRGMSTYWLTTEVIAILEDTPDYVRFKTKNSIYEWTIIP